MSTVSIALVDDHPLMVEAVFSLLSRTQGFEVVATGTTAKDVVDLCELHQPKVAIVDLSMIGDDYAAIATAIKLAPTTKIIASPPLPALNQPKERLMQVPADTS